MSENPKTPPTVRRGRLWCLWLAALVAFLLVGWLLSSTWGTYDVTRYVKLRSGPTAVFDPRSPAPFVVVVDWEAGRLERRGGFRLRESEYFVWFLGAKWSVAAKVALWRA
jgi:hypothetical protein